jgi:hypothetical protein
VNNFSEKAGEKTGKMLKLFIFKIWLKIFRIKENIAGFKEMITWSDIQSFKK